VGFSGIGAPASNFFAVLGKNLEGIRPGSATAGRGASAAGGRPGGGEPLDEGGFDGGDASCGSAATDRDPRVWWPLAGRRAWCWTVWAGCSLCVSTWAFFRPRLVCKFF